METEQRREVTYTLGHSTRELDRLSAQAKLYEPFMRQALGAAGVSAGMRVLDVGSGNGDVSLLLAEIVGPAGQVVGVDRSPIAVETATQRAQALGVPNIQFVAGDVAEMSFEQPFDAVVGRFVLMWVPDPVAVLRQLATQVRPGGVVVFQEPDWAGYRTRPVMPTWDRCVRWIIAAHEHVGAHPYLGAELFSAYTAAGLPSPTLSLNAAIGAGPEHPVYEHVAALVRSLVPAIEQAGAATADEVDASTLAERLRDEAATSGGTVIWISQISAITRIPGA